MKQYATITVIGRDKTGVIARVTNFLFEQGANIEALEEQVTRGQFSMTLQASWKRGEIAPAKLQAGLAKLALDLKMEITVRFTEAKRRQRAGIFVTREPHCLEALMTAFQTGELRAEPAVIISNRPDLKKMALQYSLPFHVFDWNERTLAEP